MTDSREGHGSFSSECGREMPIAIIGMGWRGPGEATNVQNFYELLAAAREARVAAHKGKWNHEAFYHPESSRKGTSNVEAGHYFKDDLSLFDAPFFSMTDSEAACLDPQQRLLLETCYEALENGNAAGSDTSVFVSTFGADYTDLLQKDPDTMPVYQATNSGYSRAIISNRLSHFFDFRGSSVTIDTACSGGLTALHLACQSIRAGEVRQAVCGGSSVILHPDQFISLSAMRFLSPEGRCYSFDERASGYARGEGVGCVLLKRLDHALADKDPIRAVVRMTGSNQDGRTPGISFPSRVAQMALIKSVYERAGLDPLQTSYIEAHGTGTQAGDPIETSAISETMCSERSADEPLVIGSVKTNIGHLEAASGIAALIKAVLMLENRVIFPNRNFETPNPRIALEKWKLKIPLKLQRWDCDGPHRLSINSFGYGGTNAHVILESASDFLHAAKSPYDPGQDISTSVTRIASVISPGLSNGNGTSNGISNGVSNGISNGVPNRNGNVNGNGNANGHHIGNGSLQNGHHHQHHHQAPHPRRIFSVSAFDEASTRSAAKDLAEHLRAAAAHVDDAYLRDLAHTLGARRSHFPCRAAVVAGDADELMAALADESLAVTKSAQKNPPVIGFVFTGQGAQWAGMGRELMDAFPVYARTMERCRDHLLSIGAPWDLIDELARDAKSSRISMARFSQPLCSAVQIALIELLASWGIRPQAVTGHSSGEIAAAYTAGLVGLEDAMSSAYHRGIFSQQVAAEGPIKGAMMAVGLGPDGIQERLSGLKQGYATIACENSPSSVTVSGDLAAIEELKEQLDSEGVFARKLLVEAAYHSRHMALVEEDYLDSISDMKIGPGSDVRFYSSVTGKRASGHDLGPGYWVANMLGRVRFASSLKQLCRAGADILVEVGPHSALAGPVKQIIQSDDALKASNIKYASALTRKYDAAQTVLAMAAKLLAEGVPVDLSAVNGAGGRENVVVDLPPYRWNKSKSYWAESRLSKEYRNRPHPRLDLLGKPEPNFNPFDARWRNIIRGTEVPWIKDHRIQSNVVYPAAGYVSMAIEAVRQITMAAKFLEPTGYRLRELSIGQALVIPGDTDEVETSITLRPQSEGTRVSSDTWFDFFIYSVSDDARWTEHCRGMISIDKVNDDEGIDEDATLNRLCQMAEMQHACTQEVSVDDLYANLTDIGLGYGPTFSNMTSARCMSLGQAQAARGACVAGITLPNTAAVMPAGFEYPHVVHPALLDSVFHSMFAAMGAGSGQLKHPMVPVFISELYVSGDLDKQPGRKLTVYTSTELKGARRMQASMSVVGGERPTKPVIELNGLTCMKLAGDVEQDTQQDITSTAYDFAWEVEPSMVVRRAEPALEGQVVEPAAATTSPELEYLEQTSREVLGKLVSHVASSSVPSDKPHLAAFYEWVTSLTATTESSPVSPASNGSEDTPWNHLLHYVGENLSEVVTGKQSVRELLGANDLLRDAVTNGRAVQQQTQLVAQHLGVLARLNPHLEVLEFGAGAGWSTAQFVDGIGSVGSNTPRFAKYDVVLSDAKFRDTLKANVDALDGLVNIREDADDWYSEKQDQTPEAYDVIVGVLSSLDPVPVAVSWAAACKLLRPGGTLILLEPRPDSIVSMTLFASLPSWSPTQSDQAWERAIDASGLDRTTSKADSTDNDASLVVSLISQRPVAPSPTTKPSILLVTGSIQGQSNSLVSHLTAQLIKTGLDVEVAPLEEAQGTDKVCVIFWELVGEILASLSTSQFVALKELFTRSQGVLSITRASSLRPIAGMVAGLTRTVRSEMSDGAGLSLDVDERASAQETSAAITSILSRHFWSDHGSVGTLDTEYRLVDGQILVPRLVPGTDVNRDVAVALGRVSAEEGPFIQEGRHLRAEIETPGLLDTIQFVDDDEATATLPSDHVEIDVRAMGLNFRDVMMAMGQIDVEALGGECSGLVTAVGSAVHGFAVGDRVCCIRLGTFRSRVRCDARLLQKLPDDMDFESGAALPVVYCTAFHSVFQAANLRAGETVLIHAASGGLGQALIQLCQMVGADVFVTVGSADKRALVSKRFGIPADRILSSRDKTFADAIKRLTGGRGVDVIMNSLAGEGLRLSWSCIAPFGRFIELGKRDFFVNTRLEMAKFAKNVTFAAVDLVDLIKLKPEHVADVLAKSMDLLRRGSVKSPWPITAYPMAELKTALQTMQSGRHKGKLVLVPRATDIVKVVPAPTNGALFDADAAYLLAGGMGGLGRSIGKWMVRNGARNLVFCSRSGDSSPEAKQTIRDLQDAGATVLAYACDIADEARLQQVVDDLSRKTLRVRGIIQSAMVLRDVLLENMTVDDYNTVVRPKVQGTLNLDALFPRDLDFFIMLSSISGVIGNASQAAYAAANTFMDAFASYRHGLGRPAVTIDLGVMLGIGYLAGDPELADAMRRQGFSGTTEPELMALLRSAVSRPQRGQIVTGLGTWKAGSSLGNFSGPLFSNFRRLAQRVPGEGGEHGGGDSASGLRATLGAAKDMAGATDAVCAALLKQVSVFGMVPEETIVASRPMSEYGIDSLVAVEMRNWIFRETDFTVAILELMANQPIQKLAMKIAGGTHLVSAKVKSAS
ncbi:polyketide synthase [Colletotrichum tabaci]|uniref:Polyketide synthase n=2 Tax=Colletotrichum destructivum species complex TaxID=2707350 RepID=A0AAV9T223_9PEZI